MESLLQTVLWVSKPGPGVHALFYIFPARGGGTTAHTDPVRVSGLTPDHKNEAFASVQHYNQVQFLLALNSKLCIAGPMTSAIQTTFALGALYVFKMFLSNF